MRMSSIRTGAAVAISVGLGAPSLEAFFAFSAFFSFFSRSSRFPPFSFRYGVRTVFCWKGGGLQRT
jgi:hypothetical protein